MKQIFFGFGHTWKHSLLMNFTFFQVLMTLVTIKVSFCIRKRLVHRNMINIVHQIRQSNHE